MRERKPLMHRALNSRSRERITQLCRSQCRATAVAHSYGRTRAIVLLYDRASEMYGSLSHSLAGGGGGRRSENKTIYLLLQCFIVGIVAAEREVGKRV